MDQCWPRCWAGLILHLSVDVWWRSISGAQLTSGSDLVRAFPGLVLGLLVTRKQCPGCCRDTPVIMLHCLLYNHGSWVVKLNISFCCCWICWVRMLCIDTNQRQPTMCTRGSAAFRLSLSSCGFQNTPQHRGYIHIISDGIMHQQMCSRAYIIK